MPEQVAPTLLGAMGTALVTAVGALAWMVKARSNEHNPIQNGQKHMVEDIQKALTLQTGLLQELVALAKVHNAEAAARHSAIVEALRK